MLYIYTGTVDRVIDGDTLRLIIDLGFHVRMHTTFRLLGVNTPELRGPSKPHGIAAKEFVEQQLSTCPVILVRTDRDEKGKYGRWLASVRYLPGSSDPQAIIARGRDLADELIKAGHATHYVTS